MSRTFIVEPKYYDEDRKLYKHKTVKFEPGITILVGCNGSGKSTLLEQLKTQFDKDDTPYVFYNNLTHGGIHGADAAMFHGDMGFAATLLTSSEGEAITINLSTCARQVGYMMKHLADTEAWVLLDAIDSGLSIDQVQEVKQYLFHNMLNFYPDKTIYIICAANEYEMCVDEKCFNVVDGKYVDINSYEDYKKQILSTRKYKDKWTKVN